MTRSGLDALFAGFIAHRDVPPPEARPAPFQRARVRIGRSAARVLALRRPVATGRARAGWPAPRRGSDASRASPSPSRSTARWAAGSLRPWRQRPAEGRDFPGDEAGWEAWKAWRGRQDDARAPRARSSGPLHRWLATRLVRAFPAVVALYEKVKARHRAVDQVDLLLRLRDLLRVRPRVRAEMQGLFDHVFVDEFQDTDPLQAEIILFLCEEAPERRRWQDVSLAPGKLTLVGDPKQSIYRFRRADISVYESVRAIVAQGEAPSRPAHRQLPLAAGPLAHLNERFDEILGAPAEGKPDFDAAAGTVVNQHARRRARRGRATGCVAVLPFPTRRRGKADGPRGRGVATWIRATVDGGREQVARPGDASRSARWIRRRRRPRPLHLQRRPASLAELDRLGVPWSARGGTLFLEDPLHGQFLLALRAIADRDDGVGAGGAPARALLRRGPRRPGRAPGGREGRPATRDPPGSRRRGASFASCGGAASSARPARPRATSSSGPASPAPCRLRPERPAAAGAAPRALLRARARRRRRGARLRRRHGPAARVGARAGGARPSPPRGRRRRPDHDHPPGEGARVPGRGLVGRARPARAPQWRRDALVRGAQRRGLGDRHRSSSRGRSRRAATSSRGRTATSAAERRRLVYVAATRARDLLVLPVALGGEGRPRDGRPRAVSTRRRCRVDEAWTDDARARLGEGREAAPGAGSRGSSEGLAATVEAEWSAAAAAASAPRLRARGRRCRGARARRATGRGRGRRALEGAEEPVRAAFRRDGPPRHRRTRCGSPACRRQRRWLARRRRPGSPTTSRRRPRTSAARSRRWSVRGCGGCRARTSGSSIRSPPDTRRCCSPATSTFSPSGWRAGGARLQDRRAAAGEVAASHPAYVEQVRSYAAHPGRARARGRGAGARWAPVHG